MSSALSPLAFSTAAAAARAPSARRATRAPAGSHAARRTPALTRRGALLLATGAAVPSPRSLRVRACTVVAAAAADEDDEPWEVDLQVTGMVCEGCAENVTKALQAAKGVVSVSVDLASGVATLGVKAETAFDAMNDAARLAEVVKAAGFDASPLI